LNVRASSHGIEKNVFEGWNFKNTVEACESCDGSLGTIRGLICKLKAWLVHGALLVSDPLMITRATLTTRRISRGFTLWVATK
jgi:hypothetical protein